MKNILKIILSIFISWCTILAGYLGYISYVHFSHLDGLPIIGYHGVVSDQEKETLYRHNIYYISQSTFERQMSYLAKNHYTCLSMKDIDDYFNGKISLPKKSVALTFDDGYKNFVTNVKPVIKKYNFQATCFVIGSKVNTTSCYLNQNDLINDQYVSYYSHSYDLHHFDQDNRRKKKIETASYQTIYQDFQRNKTIVDDQYFAYPYGISSPLAMKYLQSSSTKLAFGYNENRNMTRKDNRYLLPRYLLVDCMPMAYFKWIVQ